MQNKTEKQKSANSANIRMSECLGPAGKLTLQDNLLSYQINQQSQINEGCFHMNESIKLLINQRWTEYRFSFGRRLNIRTFTSGDQKLSLDASESAEPGSLNVRRDVSSDTKTDLQC